MPCLLLLVALPLAVVATLCGWMAAVHSMLPRGFERLYLRIGTAAWFGLAALSVLMALLSFHDWVHLFWSVHVPMLALFASSGLLLAGAWPGDDPPDAERTFALRPRALPAAIAVFVGLGLLPLLLLSIHDDPRAPQRATGRPWETLTETVRHGFGGPVPELMRPESERQRARGLGHPPREVTTSMGSTGVAAVWIAFACWIAIVGRGLRSAGARRTVVTALPLGVVLAAPLATEGFLVPELWRNEPWLVASYGPVVVAALASLAVLALAWLRSARSKRGGRPVP